MPGPCGNNQPGDDFDDDFALLRKSFIGLLNATFYRRDRAILDLFGNGVQLVAEAARIKWLAEDGAKAARPTPDVALADLKPADFEFPKGA